MLQLLTMKSIINYEPEFKALNFKLAYVGGASSLFMLE